jgi:branched-chain amino acid aminotransferase
LAVVAVAVDLGLDPRKCPKPTVFIIATYWGAMYGDLYDKGLKAITVSVRRNAAEALPPNAKTLNYLNNILAKLESICKGGDEAIFFDTNGYLSEGSGDNIFIVKNGTIYTPPTLNNLRGITREVVLECTKRLGIEHVEKDLGYFDLYTADEVFVTGTAAENQLRQKSDFEGSRLQYLLRWVLKTSGRHWGQLLRLVLAAPGQRYGTAISRLY